MARFFLLLIGSKKEKPSIIVEIDGDLRKCFLFLIDPLLFLIFFQKKLQEWIMHKEYISLIFDLKLTTYKLEKCIREKL